MTATQLSYSAPPDSAGRELAGWVPGTATAPRKARQKRGWSLILFALSLGLLISANASAGDHGRHRGHHGGHHSSHDYGHSRRHSRHGHGERHRGYRGHGYYDNHHRGHHRSHSRRGHHGSGYYRGPYRHGYGHYSHHDHDAAYVLGALLPVLAYETYYD